MEPLETAPIPTQENDNKKGAETTSPIRKSSKSKSKGVIKKRSLSKRRGRRTPKSFLQIFRAIKRSLSNRAHRKICILCRMLKKLTQPDSTRRTSVLHKRKAHRHRKAKHSCATKGKSHRRKSRKGRSSSRKRNSSPCGRKRKRSKSQKSCEHGSRRKRSRTPRKKTSSCKRKRTKSCISKKSSSHRRRRSMSCQTSKSSSLSTRKRKRSARSFSKKRSSSRISKRRCHSALKATRKRSHSRPRSASKNRRSKSCPARNKTSVHKKRSNSCRIRKTRSHFARNRKRFVLTCKKQSPSRTSKRTCHTALKHKTAGKQTGAKSCPAVNKTLTHKKKSNPYNMMKTKSQRVIKGKQLGCGDKRSSLSKKHRSSSQSRPRSTCSKNHPCRKKIKCPAQ